MKRGDLRFVRTRVLLPLQHFTMLIDETTPRVLLECNDLIVLIDAGFHPMTGDPVWSILTRRGLSWIWQKNIYDFTQAT